MKISYMKNYIKSKLLSFLEIDKTKGELKKALSKIENLERELNVQREKLSYRSEEISDLKKRINFLNNDYSIIADVSLTKYEPNIIIVAKRGKQDEVKTFTIGPGHIDRILDFISTFPDENVRMDCPIGFKESKNKRYNSF